MSVMRGFYARMEYPPRFFRYTDYRITGRELTAGFL